MHITQLEIRNLRSIAHARLELNRPGTDAKMAFPNVNVVLGANGTGKTTVLRAAALAALGPLLSSSAGFVPDGFTRKTSTSNSSSPQQTTSVNAKIKIEPNDIASLPSGEPPKDSIKMTTTVLQRGNYERLRAKTDPSNMSYLMEEVLFDDRSSSFFMVGYGATRRVEASTRVDESARVKARMRRYERVAGLFEEHVSLMPLSYWLPAYAKHSKRLHRQVIDLINLLLPVNCQIQESPTDTNAGTEHLFEMNGITLPFRALSDGYRAYIGWIGDMLFHLCMSAGRARNLVEMQGVVLVDEIDLHLHPEWQRTVLPTLASKLPNMQFIVTTHSPLVVGSLEAENLFMLTEEEGATVVKRLPERVHGRNAEQILLSPYFGLESTRAPDVADELQALAQKAVAGDPKASMQYLRLLSSGLPSEEPRKLQPPPPPSAAPSAPKRRMILGPANHLHPPSVEPSPPKRRLILKRPTSKK